MKSPRCRQAPISGRQPATDVHLIKDFAYRQATMWCSAWCDMTPDVYDGSSTDYLIFKNTGGSEDRFATTALCQVTCKKCKRLAAGIEREKQIETQPSNWIKVVPAEWT